jgi:serine phosphatase RsbU (regulator of sigma subunit)
MLSAVLVERRRRVAWVTLLAVVTGLVSSAANGIPWDLGQVVRFVLILASGVIGTIVADVRLRERRQLVTMREVARTAQRAIMRTDPPTPEGVDVAVRYVSASREALIGGDAYEAVDTDYGLRVLVADARGKGLPAVRSSALALGAFRVWAYTEPHLPALLEQLDRSLARESEPGNFVTALVAQLQGERLQFAVAGHPTPLLVREGRLRRLSLQTAPPLTLFFDTGEPPVGQVDLRPGDTVLLFTDGLPEARDEHGRFFPLDDVLPQVTAERDDVEEMADALLDRLRTFVHADLGDDIACVWLHVPALATPTRTD